MSVITAIDLNSELFKILPGVRVSFCRSECV